jgi:hypothetical protein
MNEHVPIYKRINGSLWPVLIFALTIIINLGVGVTTLWVKSGYVDKSEFEAYKAGQEQRREVTTEALGKIAVQLGQINEHMKTDANQDAKLDDLEKRIREQERRK